MLEKEEEFLKTLRDLFGYKEVLNNLIFLIECVRKRAKFKVGDEVQLKETIDVPKNSGWRTAAPTFIKAARGIVTESYLYNDGYTYWIKFNEEKHIISHPSEMAGQVVDPEVYYDNYRKPVYMIREDRLESVENG